MNMARMPSISPVPLSIDRVMENRPFKSTAPLFQITTDVLTIILSYINSGSLGSLALVNSDCRQLARSRQFASVRFEYSPASSDLISLLLREKTSRDQSSNSDGAIGPCIRRLTVDTNEGYLKLFHDVKHSEDFIKLEENDKNRRLDLAHQTFHEYLKRIQSTMEMRGALPNLESVNWKDSEPLSQSLFKSLTTSSTQYLKLSNAAFYSEVEIVQPSVSDRWNLRNLDLGTVSGFHKSELTSRLCASLLQSCSHSLQTLLLHDIATDGGYDFGSDRAKVPRLEKLRHLKLEWAKFRDQNTVDTLLAPSLSVLDLDHCIDNLVYQSLQTRGWMPSLEILSLTLSKLSVGSVLKFLEANTQILKLCICMSGGTADDKDEEYDAVPDQKILPLLVSSFYNLKSLRIRWNSSVTVIPNAALAMISRIETLEQVCLGAGHWWGWRYNWLIDHDTIRRHLAILPRLKKIGFTRDSYIHQTFISSGIDHERYYASRYATQAEVLADPELLPTGSNFDGNKQLWEAGHKRRMTLEANKYVASMPNLEWIYLGEYPMAVTGEIEGRQAVPLCNKRGGYEVTRTMLNGMFGWDGFVVN